MSASTDSVSPTTATDSAPSFATKNVSTIAKSDSIDISRIIGIARITSAAKIEPCVKSRCVPQNASRTTEKNELSTVSADDCTESKDIKIKPILRKKAHAKRAKERPRLRVKTHHGALGLRKL